MGVQETRYQIFNMVERNHYQLCLPDIEIKCGNKTGDYDTKIKLYNS